MIGKTLDHFEIVDRLGEGGMGEVYRARDQKLGREVAIKVLPREVAESSERLARFNEISEEFPELKVVAVRVDDLPSGVIPWSEVLAADPAMPEASIDPDDDACIFYTSGTTGPPKGAMLTHRNCLWMGHAITTDNPMSAKDEIMSFLPLCHIFEQLFTVLGHITCGHIVNFIESPDTVAENMMEISPTVGHAVPRIWEKYYSAIQIRMSDATWFKRLAFYTALKIGNKRADLEMNFKTVPFYVEWL